MGSDTVPEWALREAALLCDENLPVSVSASAVGDRIKSVFARVLTAAEQRGHARGVREERGRAVGVCERVEQEGKRHRGKSAPGTVTHYTEQGVVLGSRTCAARIRDTIASGTPGDTEGA